MNTYKTDAVSLILEGLLVVLLPLIALYIGCLWTQCKLTGRPFLEAEQKELEEARIRPLIRL